MFASKKCFHFYSSLREDEDVLLSPQVKIKGLRYAIGTILLIQYNGTEWPAFAQIKEILVILHRKIFVCIKLVTSHFNEHLNGFVVTDGIEHVVLELRDLYSPWPQWCHYAFGEKLVMLQCVGDAWQA